MSETKFHGQPMLRSRKTNHLIDSAIAVAHGKALRLAADVRGAGAVPRVQDLALFVRAELFKEGFAITKKRS